jgi:hypothetical protein
MSLALSSRKAVLMNLLLPKMLYQRLRLVSFMARAQLAVGDVLVAVEENILDAARCGPLSTSSFKRTLFSIVVSVLCSVRASALR